MHYLYPLLTLLTSLFVFHRVFIKIFPQEKKFWKQVDYIWVSLGLIGIVGSTFSYRKEVSAAWKPWHKQVFTAVFNEYQNNINQEAIFYSDTTGYSYQLVANQTEKKEYKIRSDFFNALKIKVDSCRDQILIKEDYNLVFTITTPFKTFVNEVRDSSIMLYPSSSRFYCSRAEEEANKLIELTKQENRDGLNWIVLAISPFIFAIAIAIRLTKITAEIKEIK